MAHRDIEHRDVDGRLGHPSYKPVLIREARRQHHDNFEIHTGFDLFPAGVYPVGRYSPEMRGCTVVGAQTLDGWG
jgi:hypothetical protein